MKEDLLSFVFIKFNYYVARHRRGLNHLVQAKFLFKIPMTLVAHSADSLKHRAEVRAKLAGDETWQCEYFQKVLPMFQHQDNLTLATDRPVVPCAEV